MTDRPYNKSTAYLKQNLKDYNFCPRVGLILGSGLGDVANYIDAVATFNYDQIPGFPRSTVEGHHGSLVFGFLHKIPVMCMRGRVHFYEGHSSEALKTPIYTMKLLGCDLLIVTNAVGSLKKEAGPGSLFLINDHINFFGTNPLIGRNDDDVGPRFISMQDVYDPILRQSLKEVAQQEDINLFEGIYLGSPGPMFETPAEVRMIRMLGADVTGMSLVPEVILARHCGLKILAVSVVTNLAEGISDFELSHEQTLHYAQQGGPRLQKLLLAFFKKGLHVDS